MPVSSDPTKLDLVLEVIELHSEEEIMAGTVSFRFTPVHGFNGLAKPTQA
jgi:hypothetical protein